MFQCHWQTPILTLLTSKESFMYQRPGALVPDVTGLSNSIHVSHSNNLFLIVCIYRVYILCTPVMIFGGVVKIVLPKAFRNTLTFLLPQFLWIKSNTGGYKMWYTLTTLLVLESKYWFRKKFRKNYHYQDRWCHATCPDHQPPLRSNRFFSYEECFLLPVPY